MKRSLVISALTILLIVAGYHAAAQNFKFGYINRDMLLKAIPEYDSANAKIEKFRQELLIQLTSMQSDLTNKTTALNNESKNLSDVIRKTREEELKTLDTRFQFFQAQATQQINDKNAELLQPLLDKVEKAIKDVSKEQGFTFVFDSGVLYYFDEKKTTNMIPLVKAKLGLK
jgi:outer membrane protein